MAAFNNNNSHNEYSSHNINSANPLTLSNSDRLPEGNDNVNTTINNNNIINSKHHKIPQVTHMNPHQQPHQFKLN